MLDYKCYEKCDLLKTFDLNLKKCIDQNLPKPATWKDVYDGKATAPDVLKQ